MAATTRAQRLQWRLDQDEVSKELLDTVPESFKSNISWMLKLTDMWGTPEKQKEAILEAQEREHSRGRKVKTVNPIRTMKSWNALDLPAKAENMWQYAEPRKVYRKLVEDSNCFICHATISKKAEVYHHTSPQNIYAHVACADKFRPVVPEPEPSPTPAEPEVKLDFSPPPLDHDTMKDFAAALAGEFAKIHARFDRQQEALEELRGGLTCQTK